jgi:predicted lysophospholipase L1 biosynthesis ABC-type transport system permease subunit
MFCTLESTWDHSARRGWTTFASFAVQAFGMSLLLLIPLLTIQGPTKLQWFCRLPVPAPPPTPAPLSGQQPIHSSNISQGQLL